MKNTFDIGDIVEHRGNTFGIVHTIEGKSWDKYITEGTIRCIMSDKSGNPQKINGLHGTAYNNVSFSPFEFDEVKKIGHINHEQLRVYMKEMMDEAQKTRKEMDL